MLQRSFRSVSIADVTDAMLQRIQEVAIVVACSEDDAISALARSAWCLSDACDKLYSTEVRAVAKKAVQPAAILEPTFFDPVILEHVLWNDGIELSCGHVFGLQTFKAAVTAGLSVGFAGRPPLFRCFYARETGCTAIIPPSLVQQLAPSVAESYRRLLVFHFSRTSPTCRPCSAPGCGEFILATDTELGVETGRVDEVCSNGHAICFKCGQPFHRPITCDELDAWYSRILPDGYTVRQIVERETRNIQKQIIDIDNIRTCPKCSIGIEKTGGCNHMTCREPCNYQFCWLCRQQWTAHHKCSAVVPELPAPEVVSALQANVGVPTRLGDNFALSTSYYAQRFAYHVGAIKQASTVDAVVTMLRQKLLGLGVMWDAIELECLDSARRELVFARLHVAHTYAYMSTLSQDMARLLSITQSQLEHNIATLQQRLESLGGLFSRDLHPRPPLTSCDEEVPPLVSSPASDTTAMKHFSALLPRIRDLTSSTESIRIKDLRAIEGETLITPDDWHTRGTKRVKIADPLAAYVVGSPDLIPSVSIKDDLGAQDYNLLRCSDDEFAVALAYASEND